MEAHSTMDLGWRIKTVAADHLAALLHSQRVVLVLIQEFTQMPVLRSTFSSGLVPWWQ
jgi:hypothetical protein